MNQLPILCIIALVVIVFWFHKQHRLNKLQLEVNKEVCRRLDNLEG